MIRTDIVPILSSLRKHKLTAFLLMLQAMLVCAIICNVLNLIMQRASVVSVPSGVTENAVSLIEVQSVSASGNWDSLHREAIWKLQRVPGVTDVAALDTVPLGGGETSYAICTSLDALDAAISTHSFEGSGCMQAAVLFGTEQEINTLGLKLIAGRHFLPEEYVDQKVTSAILSQSLAKRLFPDENPLGKSFYVGAQGNQPIRVVGILDHLIRPNPRDITSSEFTMLWPMLPNESSVTYAIRSAPANRERVLHSAVGALHGLDTNLIVSPEKVQTFSDMRLSFYRRDLSVMGLFLLATAILLFVTAAGISGLAKFWVHQRTRNVGIRLALGATRRDILMYFLTENFLIVGIGAALGVPMAYVVNGLLMTSYQAPRLHVSLVPLVVIVLLILGQMAAFMPALRASKVSPMESIRYQR